MAYLFYSYYSFSYAALILFKNAFIIKLGPSFFSITYLLYADGLSFYPSDF